jgi:hypothetical protein
MATHTPAVAVVDETAKQTRGRLAFDIVHDWITTVDHKKIG